MTSYTVSMNDNEIEIDGITFIVNVSDHANGGVSLEIPGGYGEDVDGEWMEVDGNFHIRELMDSNESITHYDQEFEVEITEADVQKAKEYRAVYPESVE